MVWKIGFTMTNKEQEIRDAIAEFENDPQYDGLLDAYHSPLAQEEMRKFMLEALSLLDNDAHDPAMDFIMEYEPLANGIASMIGPYSADADLDPAGMKKLVGLLQAVQAATIVALRRM